MARPIFLMFVICLLYTLASTMDYLHGEAQAKENVQELLYAWQKVGLNCVNQAEAERRGKRIVNSLQFDNNVYSVECGLLERNANAQ